MSLSLQPLQTSVSSFSGSATLPPYAVGGLASAPLNLVNVEGPSGFGAWTQPVSSEQSSAWPASRLSAPPSSEREDNAPAADPTTASSASNADEQSREPVQEAAVVVRGPLSGPTYQFSLLQQWEGKVLSLEEGEFWALVHDLTNPENDPEEVELSKSEVPPGDLSLLEPGAIFYWSIGLKKSDHGQVERTSSIRLRRTPVWTQRTIDGVKRSADRLEARFGIRD